MSATTAVTTTVVTVTEYDPTPKAEYDPENDVLVISGEGPLPRKFVLDNRASHIIIGDGITEIPDGTFDYYPQLESIVLGKGITDNPSRTFYGCYSLSKLGAYGKIESIGNLAFDGAALTEIGGQNGDLLEQYAIDNGITYYYLYPEELIPIPPEETTEPISLVTSESTTTVTTTITTSATTATSTTTTTATASTTAVNSTATAEETSTTATSSTVLSTSTTTMSFVYYSTDFTTTASTTQTTAASSTGEQGSTTTETNPAQPENGFGDLTVDGKVDAKDASLILVAYSLASTGAEDGLTETQCSAADVNDDDKVDAKDASAILAYYALASTAAGDIPTMSEYMSTKVS